MWKVRIINPFIVIVVSNFKLREKKNYLMLIYAQVKPFVDYRKRCIVIVIRRLNILVKPKFYAGKVKKFSELIYPIISQIERVTLQ